MIKKLNILLLSTVMLFLLSACSYSNDSRQKQVESTQSPAVNVEELINKEPRETQIPKPKTVMKEVDYSDCFHGVEGTAVFYNSKENKYRIYNKEASETLYSPCSTFKIVATILGLENGVVEDANSRMHYNGTTYSFDAWNNDLTLEDAFKASCVWYYRQVMDKIEKKEVEKLLNELDYGNCDISEWDGSELNPSPELNGFWLESSLKISPKEQVQAMAKIFDESTSISSEYIQILKEVMFFKQDNELYFYGKTGTGRENGWFVGFLEKQDERWYFAVNLQESDEATGKTAQNILLSIANKYYK